MKHAVHTLKLLFLSFTLLFALFIIHYSLFVGPAQAQTKEPDYACIGEKTADYMNSVIRGAGGLSHIKLLSPAFNMTNPASLGIIASMKKNGARFNDEKLVAIAGNSYNLSGKTITGWIDEFMANSGFEGRRIFITETGSLDASLDNALGSELAKIKGDPQYIGALLFNLFNTNEQFGQFAKSDSEIASLCSGSCGKIGVNSAAYFHQDSGYYSRAGGHSMGFSLEIASTDIAATVEGLNLAHSQGLTPIIRIGTAAGSGGFDNVQDYVNFLRAVNAQVDFDVYAIAGPNEPDGEYWVAPECAGIPKDRSEVNFPERPYPNPYVPCDETRSNEFHADRPYQASPCDNELNAQGDLALFCGNSLTVKQNVSFNISNAARCEPTNNGQRCYFNAGRTETVDIAVDLSNARLPILGNTELDANILNEESALTPEEKMNEYVSWYLTGVVNPVATVLSKTEIVPARFPDFAGPLIKLLPLRIQNQAREEQIKNAGETRHDQIVACDPTRDSQFGCADAKDEGFFWTGSIFDVVHRLSDWEKRLPPHEEGYKTLAQYWKEYREWQGGAWCFTNLLGTGLQLCVDNPFESESTYLYKLWSFIPLTSTEDRKGQAFLPEGDITGLVSTPGTELKVVNANFTPTTAAGKTLYFSHIEEVKGLAELLQGTFKSKDEPGWKAEDTGEASPPYCEWVDVRTNPGDSLFGGPIDSLGEKQISGKLTFTTEGEVSCDFNTDSEQQGCDKQVYIAMALQNHTPSSNEIWERLVNGGASAFKRIFPKIGPGSPVAELKDLPASTQVTYTSSSQVMAGDPAKNRSGENAQLFFPHLGGVYEYFLKGIQTALRPKGYGETILAGQGTATTPGQCKINCNQSAVLSPTAQKYAFLKPKVIDLATRWTGGTGQHQAEECFNDVVNQATASGVNPAFALLIWLNESGASNYTSNVTSCNTQDFGINISTIAANFSEQLNSFLKLPKSSDYLKCAQDESKGWETPMHGFLNRFQAGGCDLENESGNEYFQGIRQKWEFLSLDCPFPNYPTDLSCP